MRTGPNLIDIDFVGGISQSRSRREWLTRRRKAREDWGLAPDDCGRYSMVTARILLRAPFTAMQTGLVSQLLRQHANEVEETRKALLGVHRQRSPLFVDCVSNALPSRYVV